MWSGTVRISIVLSALFFSLLIVAVAAQPVVAVKPQPVTHVNIDFSVVFGVAIEQGKLTNPPAGDTANPCDYPDRTAIFTLISTGTGTLDDRDVAKGLFTSDVSFQMWNFDYVDDSCVPSEFISERLFEDVPGTWRAIATTTTPEFDIQFSNKQEIIHGLMTTRMPDKNPVTIEGLNGYLVIDNKAWIAGSPTGFFDVTLTPIIPE